MRNIIAGHFRFIAKIFEARAIIRPLINMDSIILACSDDNTKNKNHEMKPNIAQSKKCTLRTRKRIANAVVPMPAIMLRTIIELSEFIFRLEVYKGIIETLVRAD